MPRLRPTTLPLLLCFAVLSSGCGWTKPPPDTIVETRIERQAVPAALLVCADRPAVPSSATQAAVARLIVAYDQAHADCKAKLRAIEQLQGDPSMPALSGGGGGRDYEVIVFLCPVDAVAPDNRCDAWSVTDEKGPYPTFALCAARATAAKDPDGWLARLLRALGHPYVNVFLGCREVREVTA